MKYNFDCPIIDAECPYNGENGCCQLDCPEEDCEYCFFDEEMKNKE